ncbi:MFS transporter [Actinomyces radicidentis]|uniref:MFS transporter n=1 Tax=Actinomyces radicidentis TaxID=111015 RepID=UPI0026E102C6|nr:MFS transporter [Actinomyces radicidentis]
MPPEQNEAPDAVSSTFDSLRFHNYRIWFFAALVANTGTWMQRVAQDWLVLRILTEDSASATGITTALQFLPAMVFSVHAGLVADRVDQRRFLVLTQTSMGVVSLVLGADVIAGHAELWHVYLAALLTGCASAYDSPARQIFVARMVPGDHLANAVGLNSASFNAARLLGPAVGGLAITWVGPGWVFVVNALTFLFPAAALLSMRVKDLYDVPRAERAKGQMREGLAYVRHRADIVVIIVVISVVSMLTLNFQVTMAAMVRHAFNMESDAYGTVSSVFAIGSLAGALWAARRKRPRVRTLVMASFLLGVSSLVMAAMPTYPLFALSSIPVGLCVLTVLTSANQTVQLTTEPAMRGRVMSIYMMFFLGTTPIGSPVIGWVSDEWNPRVAIAVGGAAAIIVSLLAALWAREHWHIDLTHTATRSILAAVGRGDRTGIQAPGPLAGETTEAVGAEMLAEITGNDDELVAGLDGVGGVAPDRGAGAPGDPADGVDGSHRPDDDGPSGSRPSSA